MFDETEEFVPMSRERIACSILVAMHEHDGLVAYCHLAGFDKVTALYIDKDDVVNFMYKLSEYDPIEVYTVDELSKMTEELMQDSGGDFLN